MTEASAMKPASVPSDIYRLLSEGAESVSEANVLAAGEAFMSLLRTRLTKRKKSTPLRFSSLGKKDRQLWYEEHDAPAEEPTGPMLFKFLYGDVIELLLLFLTKESGHEVTHEQHEVSVDGVFGHTDCCIDGVPVDCKSASPYSFGKFADGSFVFDDPFGYVQQLSGYCHALGRTDEGGFLVADKVNGSITYAPLDGLTIKGNPPADRITNLRETLAKDEPPERCYEDVPEGKSGNRKLGIGCSYCKFKEHCWADSNNGQGLKKYFYSRGPVWLTNVAKEPRVERG